MVSDKYDVRASQRVREDLATAVSYYQRVAGSASAQKLVDRFDDVSAYLESVPTAAARIGETEYRWLPVGRYVLVYTIDEDLKTVTMLRLHYESSNWREMLER